MNYNSVMPLALPDHLLSVEEYLEFEQKASVRHEYVAGTLYALAGATKKHNLIISNLIFRLMSASRGTLCRVYSEGVKVRPVDNLFYYPDVMVACHGREGDPLFETEPCLLIEVLSESTAHIDKREKLVAYQQLRSLQTYLIIHQDKKLVECHWPSNEGRWQHAQIAEGEEIALECPHLVLSAKEVYEGINLQ